MGGQQTLRPSLRPARHALASARSAAAIAAVATTLVLGGLDWLRLFNG